MAGEKYTVRNVRSKVEQEVSVKEWETIQSNQLVAKHYVVVSAPSLKAVKAEKATEENK